MIRIALLEAPGPAVPMLHTLRHSLDEQTLQRRFERACAQGYRVMAAFRGDTVVGALGYRIVEDLCWGRTLFVDDLVVDETMRSEGIGRALLDRARAHADALGCDHLRLCSGFVWEKAHRFYDTNGLERRSIQFVLPLARG